MQRPGRRFYPDAISLNVFTKDDSPQRFFRRTIYETLQGSIERGHETLLDTLTAITAQRSPQQVICPVEDCPNGQVTPPTSGEDLCPCSKREPLYQTDVLGIHERFDDTGPNGQVYTLFQQVTEQLTLANILRYCEQAGNPEFIRDTAFIMDGPLAVFGSAAWLHTRMQREVERIHNRHTAAGYPGVLLLGIEKTGHFMEHLKQLDWSDHDGPKQALPISTAFAPTSEYINRHILHRPPGSNPFGRQTYYGRKILYKNRNGQHSVITTPIVNDAGRNAECVAIEAFPRLGEILGIMDDLSTYLYEDGFAPLVRAHAHAAIPLKAGRRNPPQDVSPIYENLKRHPEIQYRRISLGRHRAILRYVPHRVYRLGSRRVYQAGRHYHRPIRRPGRYHIQRRYCRPLRRWH